ncbi:MAG: FHA domain-containing protein [Leucobacter sp.]
MSAKIPAYPVVTATLAVDGSAHVTAAGDHRDYPAGSIADTREAIIAYAAAIAARLGRGVRMLTVDPDGRWELVVFADGTVESLEQTPARKRRRRAPATEPIATLACMPAPAQPSLTPSAPMRPPSSSLTATIRFTTGDVAIVAERAIIGREPEADSAPDDTALQRIAVADPSKTMSRLHAELAWNGGKLWIIDRDSGNGTTLYPLSGTVELRPGDPVEVANGDTIQFGPIVRATVTFNQISTP